MTYLLCHPAASPRDSPTQGTINSRPTGHEDTRRTGRHEIRALWLRADPPMGLAAAKPGTSRTRPARSGARGESSPGRSARLAPLDPLPDGRWANLEARPPIPKCRRPRASGPRPKAGPSGPAAKFASSTPSPPGGAHGPSPAVADQAQRCYHPDATAGVDSARSKHRFPQGASLPPVSFPLLCTRCELRLALCVVVALPAPP